MPTYGYKCRQCDEEFDVVQKINDAPPSECPTCGGPVKRVFHPVGIIFKGSGFYSTDNKRQPAPGKAKTEGAEAKENGGGDKKDAGDKGDAGAKENSGAKKPAPEKAAT